MSIRARKKARLPLGLYVRSVFSPTRELYSPSHGDGSSGTIGTTHQVDPPTCTSENGSDCRCEWIVSGRKMTDQTVRRKLESFSSLETFSVVAIFLILVMIAVPFPYASENHWLPAARPALGQGNAADETKGSGTLAGTSGGKMGTAGHTSQGSPFEVRTVVQREFCADMPGVVRFRSSGPSCKNGTFISNLQRRREQLKP